MRVKRVSLLQHDAEFTAVMESLAEFAPQEQELTYSEEGFKEKAREIWEKIYQTIMSFWSKIKVLWHKYLGRSKGYVEKIDSFLHHLDSLKRNNAKSEHKTLVLSVLEARHLVETNSPLKAAPLMVAPSILEAAMSFMNTEYRTYVYSMIAAVSRTISGFHPGEGEKRASALSKELAAMDVRAVTMWSGNEMELPDLAKLRLARSSEGVEKAYFETNSRADVGSMKEIKMPSLDDLKAVLLKYKAMLKQVMTYHTQTCPYLDQAHLKLLQDTSRAMRSLNEVTEGADNAHSALVGFHRCANYNVVMAELIKDPGVELLQLVESVCSSAMGVTRKILQEYARTSNVEDKQVKT